MDGGASPFFLRSRSSGEAMPSASNKDLVSEYQGLLGYLSDVFYGKAKSAGCILYDKGDFHSAGVIGLLEAKARFDPTRCNKFQPYAVLSIRWAMQKTLNQALGRPEWAVTKQRRLNDDTAVLEHLLGRGASNEELADFLSIDLKDLELLQHKLNEAMRVRDSSFFVEDILFDDFDIERELTLQRVGTVIAGVMSKLTDKQRRVLELFFEEGLGVTEISQAMSMSKPGVCNARLRALRVLAKYIQKDLPDEDLETLCS